MRFNLMVRALLMGAASVLGFVGCSLNEGPAPQKKRQIKDGNGCLQNLHEKFDRYFDGKLSDAEIDEVAACATDAITRFEGVVRGNQKGTFTASEVRNFLAYYYLDDFVVSDAMLGEIMRIKITLLGGHNGEFAADDLDRARVVVRTVADQFKILRPHMPYDADEISKRSVESVESAIAAVKRIATNIASLVQDQKPGYSLVDLDHLLVEMQRTFPKSKGLSAMRESIPLASSVKDAFLSRGKDRDTISAADWKTLLEEGSDYFGIFLRLKHLQNHYPVWTRGAGRERLMVIANQAITSLERIPSRHGSNNRAVISFASIYRVIDALEWDGVVGTAQIRMLTVKQELVPLFQRVLGGTDGSARGRAAGGITVEALERARTALKEWNEGSRYVEGVFSELSGGATKFTQTTAYSAPALASVPVEKALRAGGGVTALGSEMAADLRRVMVPDTEKGTRHPMIAPSLITDESGRIHFETDLYTRPKTYADLVNYAWMRPLFRLVIRGYIAGAPASLAKRSAKIADAGLTEAEFSRMVTDFWPVLVDLKYLGQWSRPSLDSAKRFMEANLFSFAGNGDDQIDMNEASHLLMFLVSTKSISTAMMKRMHIECGKGAEDEFGIPMIPADCFRNRALNFDPESSPVKDLYRSFPNFMRFYEGLSAAQRKSLSEALPNPVRTADNVAAEKAGKNPDFNSTEIDAIIMMLHYVESMYMRFDTGGVRGSFDYAESLGALKVFKRTLGQFAKMDPDSYKLKAVFAWLLTRGSPPDPKDKGDVAKFVAWMGGGGLRGIFRGKAKQWEFECNRSTVVKVFGTITKMASEESGDADALDRALHEEDPWIDTIPDWDTAADPDVRGTSLAVPAA